jgi:hypothetical protein
MGMIVKEDLGGVGVHVPNTRDFGIIYVPLQSIPPAKSLHATSDHQPPLEHIGSSLDALLVSHVLPDIFPVQVGPIYPNSTAGPLFRVFPTTVNLHVAVQF